MIMDIKNIERSSRDKKQDFIFNVIIGVFIMLIFTALKDTAMRQNIINHWFDYYIKLRMNSDTETKRASDNLVFLDFDNKSMRDLGRPEMIPRNKIADLVRFAYNGGAGIIIIDLDFSVRDYTPERLLAGDNEQMTGQDRDNILFNLLRQIREDTDSPTKIFLPVTAYSDREQKNNIFAELFDNKKIYPVTPNFTLSNPDNVVRFWMPYFEAIESNTHNHNVLWSMPLLSLALFYGDFDEIDKLKHEVIEGENNSFTLNIRRDNSEHKFTFYRENSHENELIRDSKYLQYNRIQYTFLPPNTTPNAPFGTIPLNRIGHWRKKGIDNKRIDYKGKIVIIGRADSDAMDFYATIAGRMSGMYIHGNSIATILGRTQPHLASVYKYILVETILIIAASSVFLCANSLVAIFIIVIMTILCWLGTYWYFQITNEFIYTSFAFAGMGLYRIINMRRKFMKSLSGGKK